MKNIQDLSPEEIEIYNNKCGIKEKLPSDKKWWEFLSIEERLLAKLRYPEENIHVFPLKFKCKYCGYNNYLTETTCQECYKVNYK